MHPSSPWAQWDPIQPGSLKPRRNDKRIPLPEDLVLILENTPECVPDPLLREYLLRALRGELRRPRGRQASKLCLFQCLVADILIEMEVEAVRGEITSGELRRGRGDLEPKAIAADRVVKRFGNFTGRHLLNQISNMKNGRI